VYSKLVWVSDDAGTNVNPTFIGLRVVSTAIWWEDLRNLLDASKAKPVMSAHEREHVERRRLGLTQRPRINGSVRSNA